MEKNEITVQNPVNTNLNMFANQENFNTGYKMAQILSASTIIPKTFQGNIGNTMIAIDIAQRLHSNPLMIMQNMYVVYGMPAFSAKFLVACINASGLFASPLRYAFVGKENTDSWGCYAYVVDEEGEVLKGSTITIDMAKKKGWYDREGSNWKIEPEQMLRYRAASRFQSAYCPEITCGLSIKEEIENAEYTEITQDNIEQLSEDKEDNKSNSQPLSMNINAAENKKKGTDNKKQQNMFN